jgi:hypothetical protein
MNIGEAITQLKNGKTGMRLPKWQPDVTIRLQTPDEHSKMTAPYLYANSRFGNVPWCNTQIELLSEEWEIAE